MPASPAKCEVGKIAFSPIEMRDKKKPKEKSENVSIIHGMKLDNGGLVLDQLGWGAVAFGVSCRDRALGAGSVALDIRTRVVFKFVGYVNVGENGRLLFWLREDTGRLGRRPRRDSQWSHLSWCVVQLSMSGTILCSPPGSL